MVSFDYKKTLLCYYYENKNILIGRLNMIVTTGHNIK